MILGNFENVSDRLSFKKLIKICELLSAGDETIWRTIATVMTGAVPAVSVSTVNLRKYQSMRTRDD